MKILHLCAWYLPKSVGGTEIYVAELVRRQRARGHDVRVAAPDAGVTAPRTYQHDGALVLRYPVPAAPTRAEARHTAQARGAEHLHAWLDWWKPDILHVHTFATGVGPWEVKAGIAAGARVVCTTHSAALGFLCARGTLLRWGRVPCDGVPGPAKCTACLHQLAGIPRPIADLASLIPVPIASLLGRLPGPVGTRLGLPAYIRNSLRLQTATLQALDAFVVLTDAGRQMVLRQDPGARVLLNRLGVRDRPVRAPVRRPPDGRVLTVAYVGRLDPIKGIFDFARAIRSLGARVPLRFEFRSPAGSSQQLRMTDRIKRIVGPDAHVRFGPALPEAEVSAFLASVDVLCCPSRTFEGGPTVALEALAVGTPVIGTRMGGLAEIVEEGVNGRLVPPGDWRALAEVLRSIGRDRSLVDAWRRGIGPVRTMDEVASDYEVLYRDVLGGGS
ncbi:MAG: glycosyltransferase [Vicinamibacterales bacterium]